MGLFSKETFVCSKCGKEFSARFNSSGMCKECTEAEIKAVQKEENEKFARGMSVDGYSEYAKKVLNYKEFDEQELIDHRNKIIDKNKWGDAAVHLNYSAAVDSMQGDHNQIEASNEAKGRPIVKYTTGGYYSPGFFMPEQYDGTIIDADDVFAVCVTQDAGQSSVFNEAIKVVFFTNDPYIPVFWLLFWGKTKLLSLSTKSKKGREAIMDHFSEICPNLTYPICDLKELKKMIKADDAVKGNVDKKFILKQLSDAGMSYGFYDAKKTSNRALYTHYIIGKMGYGVEHFE